MFDSGAWLTLVSNEVFDEQLSHKVTLKDPDVIPGGYGGQTIDLRGYFEAEITYQSNIIRGKVYVPVKGDNVLSWPHQGDLKVILDPNSPSPVMTKEDYVNSLTCIEELQVVTFTATVQAPGLHRQYPEGTNQSDNHPEENPNPDIRVESTSQEPEKERTEAEEERDVREQSVERSGSRNERSEKEEDQSEERSEEIGGETPNRTRPLDERTSHVSGRVWLSQVRLCLRLSYFPL
ncbi:hypothetical protein NDU88_002634 [Pleurodeles waltl]|uniref:Peptidase A2 domain-containing protein n=1 Tax=Pleurodeles waltl TaxID=8319 RepID=A0AAV7UXM7_PLEWA|nr:hypothetical protein NDU88_002634 [Pleurodeles waltl]